jgi:hypothetical protein
MQGSDGSCARRSAAARSHAASELARPAAWSRRGRQSPDSTPSPRGGAGGSRAVAGASRPGESLERVIWRMPAGHPAMRLRGGCQCALPRVRATTYTKHALLSMRSNPHPATATQTSITKPSPHAPSNQDITGDAAPTRSNSRPGLRTRSRRRQGPATGERKCACKCDRTLEAFGRLLRERSAQD